MAETRRCLICGEPLDDDHGRIEDVCWDCIREQENG